MGETLGYAVLILISLFFLLPVLAGLFVVLCALVGAVGVGIDHLSRK